MEAPGASRPQLYVDMVSQPARACLLLVKLAALPVEVKVVNIAKGGNRAPEYVALTGGKTGKNVPILVDAGGTVLESCTILRYLCRKFDLESNDSFYPDNLLTRARVDAALDWHHSALRPGCAGLAWHFVVSKRLGRPSSQEKLEMAQQLTVDSLDRMENYWVKDRAFVAGDKLSIADLVLSQEIQQLVLLDLAQDGTDLEEVLAPYAGVRNWLQRVRAACGPHYEAATKLLFKSAARRKGAVAAVRPKL